MADASLPKPMPGQGKCPPGMRPTTYEGQQKGSTACKPIGPGVPAGGWKPAREAGGAGYPPSWDQAKAAFDAATWAGERGGAATNYANDYADWIRGMSRR